MAIDRSKLQRMYKLMADNGYTQDYNTFEKKFTGNSNYANRKAVYDLFTKNGADLGGSYEVFMRKLQKPRATKPQQQPKTALGRAQQSVAKEKWGGGVVTHGNTTAYESASAPMENDSELVRGLKNANAVQRLQAPVSYTKPGAVKQMVKQTRERQHVVGQNVEQAGREFTNRERDRRNAPAFDLGNENVNNNIVKTRGQLEDELEESSRQLVDKQLGGYVTKSIEDMFKDAEARGLAAATTVRSFTPYADIAAGKVYNEALDPDKLMGQLSKNAEKDMAGLFSDPKMQKEIVEKAASFGIDPEDYVKSYIAPGLQAKIAEEFEKSELSRNMPKSTTEYIIRGVTESMIGTILSMSMMSKKQRQYAQQGMAMTDEGENPYVKPGMGARVARGTLSFVADAPVFGAAGKAGAAVAGKAFGNGVAQTARIANASLGGRIARMVGSGMVSQGVTGVLYGSTNAAVQNYSTGDDTSIGNTVKLMTMGGVSEGASWATMGGIGGVVGGSLYNVSGLKRIPAKVFQIAMEGVGMHMGGNVAKMIEGHDTDWLSVEGNLEACANVVALKLTHARLPKRYAKDGKKESYLDMVKRNLANLMVSDGQRASFGGYTFTNEEKEQLFGSNKAPLRKMYERLIEDMPLRPEGFTHWALRTKKTTAKGKGEESYKDTDAEFVKTAYDEIMADNTIPWDTKAKFSALVMGTVPSSRPMMEYIGYGGGTISEYSKYGELLSEHIVKTEDERVSVVYSLRQRRENQRLSNAYGAAQIKDEKTAQETLETVAETFGFTAEQLKAAMDKDPLKRSEEEQNACVALRKAYEGEQFPEGTLHPDQSQTEGKDVVEENNLGTENPNNEAVDEVLNNMKNAEKAFNAALESNDVLKQEYERLTKEGLSEPQIYMELFNSGLTQEQLAPFADYINAKAKAVGMYRGTEQKIAETVQKHVEQWSYKGELNGEKQEGGQMLFVKDNNGRLLIVGAGDVAFDSEGRARENVGDMLSVLDPNTKEMDFVSKKDVQLDHVEKTEDYAKNYQEMLEVMNSVAYAESEKVKEKSEKSDTKTESVVTPKEGASAPGVEDVKPIGEGEKKNPSDNGNGSNETLTFADGSPVPMMKDTKGRETADYSQMTPEQGAEWMSSQFGENAEAAVDGQIMRAEKMLKEAEKIKVDYTGDLNDAKEAEAQKAKAVDAAKAELELYTNIKKVMTANKVKAGMEKVGSVGEEGSVSEAGNLGAVREKFESGKRIVGNKRTRTLADGSKLRGHYEIVEADSLTPSHNANDGYKKSEGFPVNEEGRTINDRDYENDKQAQLVTDMIAMKYDGQAVDQVPVVTSDGIVVDGNGRTMAGQKAAKNGTDSAYLEALKENAENYGFTAEQIEQSGIKHPRLVLVSDEPMKYDTATFAKFNKNEKKSQGNTQQAVANSKKLSADEIGTIISEIEGSGSLDAFFNNPTAINSLLKRLIDKGVIGLNEVAGLREGEDKLSAAGKDFVKNLLLGSVFSENTIRMMGADAMLKTKALNGIRAVTDNMKLGDYALMKEIDQAVQLLYEARQGGSGVDAYLRTPAMFGENAADRFDPISQAIALALEGKAEDFRELMMAYNRNAAPYADANQTEMFGERPTNEEFIKEFLKLRNWKDYETRHSSKEGNGDAGSSEGTEPQAPGGNVITSEADYNKAVEQLKEAKGEERERILDQMGEYVKEFAKSNGYDEPVVLRTKQDLADAAKTENDKTIIENMPEGAHYPGYYEDGKIHIYLEGSTGSEELRETFEHESVHADNEVDPSRVEALVYSITDMNTLTREELERVVEVLSNMKEYTERASEMDDTDALYMLADEALAHLVTYAQEHGKDAMSEITDNPTLLNIAEKSLKERENDRRRKEGLAKSGDKTLERKNIDDVSTEENGGPLEGDKEDKPGNDNGGSPDRDVQATEGQRQVDKAVKRIATEITKKTGIEVVTDEKEAEEVIRESEETDSDLKYHKETDEATLEELENGETVKVYRAMQVIDGKLYPPMAAAVNGKRVEANELGTWIRADENPDLAIPDIDPKTKEQKVDKKTGELKWKFKLDKGGKDATGKKATDIPAAYNPYWHTSRSPLNDQFKSAWIRPNIVVVECEVPVSELSSGYRAERAKDAVGEVDWKSGVVSGEVYKQTGRARKVILSRWCKPVRVLSDAEVAQRAKEFVGDAKVEIPENVLTPRQRIEFEKAGFKIGAPEKGVKKSDQILEALKRGLQIDNEIKEHRSRWAGGEVVGMKQLPDKLHTDPDMLWNEISQYHGDYITRKLEKVPEDGTVKFFSAHDGKWYFYSVDKNHTITLFDAVEASRENYELFKDKLKKYGFDGTTKAVREDMQETGYTGRTNSDKLESFIRPGLERGDRLGNGRSWRESGADRRGMAGETDGTQLEGNSEKQGEVKYFRTANGEVYGFTDGEKIYLDTKKMKPETPLHEYAHLWCDMLRKVNPKEWENVKKLFDKVEGLKEEVQKLYPELEGDALYEEMITTYSGREGTKKLEDVVRKLAAEEGKSVTESAKAQGFLEKVKVALTKYWKGVADVLGIHFTTAEEVADKVLADWAKGVDPRGSEKGKVKSEESDSKVEGVVTPKGDIKDATEPKGDNVTAPKGEKTKEEPSKTNPLAWLAHTAEMYKDEQVQKAKEELTKAKESGDASDIKRATADMKQAMETKLRGNGIGLVERRRIIGRELGKILGEEAGKAEAEKIDKPWKDMDGEERMTTAEKNPLTEEEIRNNTSEENKSLIDDAVDYVNGNHGIVQQIAYLKIYDDVRNRHEDAPDNSGAEDRTQLAATDNGGSKELGVGTGREGGGSSEQLGDGTSGEGRPEQLQHGSKNSAGQSDVPAGEGSHSQGEGEAPGLGGVPTGNTQRERGSNDGSNGATVRHERGRGSGDKTATTNGGRKPTAKQGTHFPDNSTLEQKKQNTAAKKAALKDALKNWAKLGRGELGINLAGLNSRQIEYLPEVMKAVKDYGVALIDEGIYRVKDWIKSIREAIGEDMKGMKFSDKDIDGFIEEMWNSKYTMNGETHTIGEWADIYGQEKLRKELAGPLTDKAKRQIEVEDVPVKIGDKANIEETLPFLLPQQQEDVLKAETQFFGNEHADREHAYGKGYMFTNGTGTGKTYTGLGIAKRLVKQGKGRILIVTPSQKKVSDWIKDGHNLNMEIRDLDSWAKDRGTTATTESGEGVVITTFANFGVNKKLLETKWDAVIYDESHRIMENKKGTETARSMQHYMLTNRDERHCFLRLQEINKDYQKMKGLAERFDAEREKEMERIRKEYKASHPSATKRDVDYATSRMMPKDRSGFVPGDYVSFPKLGKIHAEYVKALSHYTNDVKPKLEAQAKNEWKDTKTIFLSATPFNTRENLDYAEGYIFKYPEGEKGGRMSGRTQFYLDHFGAAYKYRFNRLEQSTSNPEAVAKQEIEFSDYLQHTLGTMSGRIIDSPYDYSRDFPTVSPDHAERFNQAVQEALTSNSVLAEAYRKTIGDYNYGSALFETMKVANIIERIKAHLDAGRKVVIFHRRVDTKEPIKPPFAFMLEKANRLITIMNEGNDKKNEAIQAVRDFRKKYADLLKWEQTLDYSMPREQIAKVFGKDNVLFFSGKESSKVKDKAVDTFNDDNSGKNIIVIQEASGKEGISLHDKTGEHQRVCITLALPQSPITALQIEGRTYRIGNKSNAIFEYPILGLNSEMMLFGQKFNNQVSTTENLALGSQARSLRDSFANGILEHSGVVPIDQQGVGGKEFDAPKEQNADPYDDAVLDYYSNQKLNSRNREGVDYFPTPEPLGYKMMEWANMGEGDTVMEPSAGHGAIARYAPKGNQMVAIEPSQSLFAKLQLKAGGLGRKFVNTIFENYDISNKHDVVVMNPPFGTAGATAIAHLGKAFKHLEEGGRVVALIPRGSTDKKFEKWINGEKTAVMRAEVELPDIVFKQAGTNVVCRVVVVDKISNEAMRAKAGRVEKVSLGGHYDKIEDFFEDLRDVEMPDRIIDTNTIMQKKSKQTAKDLKELKDVTVNLNEHGINVHVRGDRNDYSIMFDLGEYNAEQRKSILSGTYERFEEYERYTRDETSQAVIAELKKLTCKLAGITEEEMQRYLKKQNDGKGVMYRVEHAAEVYGKANAHYRMELGDTFSDSKEHFDAVRDRAVEEKGIVMPNLNKEKVKVVEVEKHGFEGDSKGAIEEARTWAKENLVTTNKQDLPTMRDGTPYTISKKAVEKYLSLSAVSKSDELGVHLSVLPKLTDVIHESIEAEIHADYKKGEDGTRGIENGYGEGVLVHRLYGAVEIDGKTYRVKTTMQEFRGGEENKPHSYEVTKIELLDSPGKRENPDRPHSDASNNSIDNKIELPDAPGTAVLPDSSPLDTTPSNSKNITSEGSEKANESDSLPLNSTTNGYISTAKLLQGVEKSYDSGKKLLDESKDLTDGETFFRKEGDGVVTPEKTSNTMSERIIETVEKVAKRTGGKVKMVNSVEEIENPKVRKDIENGKQVTGWYDEKTGEVHLYMPNIHDSYTAEKTVWHETVGHKGMRGLLGDKFDSYMRDLWMDLDNPINAELRAYVKEKMNMNHLGFYDAIEEFIAKSAEDGKGEPGFWNYIKNKVTDALHEIGYRVSPNVKDVKYMLWLAKNVQKHGDSPLWKMRAEAVRWKIEHEKTEYTKIEGGELYDNDGKSHDFEGMSREEWLEATDGEIHYRTAPNAATALDRYHHALDRHSYMATEAFMDNMLALKKLMEAIDPSIKKIEDVASSMNPYLMQNITEGMMSDKSKLFEIRYMDPLSKAMSSVLDSFDGKKVEDRIRNFNLYMIRKHGLERNRVLFVRDWVREKRKVESEKSNADAMEAAWKNKKSDLRQKLESGQIDLKEYYRQMDEWIVTNLDKDFKAEEHDYSGMHGLQGIADKKAPYDDAGAIDEVMSQEASMESMKKGSVADFWKKVKAATDYSVNSDYESGLISQITHDGVLGMFDWYVPLRKFDEATAEDVYGYVTEMGDPSNYIGTTLMNAKGRKSLSNVEILAQIGLMGNRAIRNGGQNTIKQAFARFVRNSGEQNLVKETKVWVEKIGTDRNGNDIWEEAYPKIPEGASADDVASIVDAFETDMRTKQAKGEAKSLSNSTDIGFKFQRAKDKSQHFVDVKIAGRTHRFVVLGNPRAAQALNGMLENGKASQKWLQTVTRWMAMASTSWSPEFVMRNIVRDAEFASSHVRAKEGGRYAKKWARYYGELNPLNVFYNEGAGRLKSMKMKDFKNGVGFGLYARYREGTLGNSKMERYFKEFMENGGETGFVQLFSMHDMEKSYKSIVEKESAKGAKKVMVNAMEVLKNLGKNVESLNEVAENMARFATYCTSRDLGRSAARSAYDAKEVSTNFNRHGSGDEIKSFKNGEMSGWQKTRRNTYGFVAGYLRNYSMFFNAGIQSTNLLFKNIKRAPVGTAVAMTSAPFALALIMAAVNNAIIQNEDDKDRGNVKDPYGELPDYIRRNNLCIYVGNNKFVTVPLAIELRAFYSLGDLAAGQTFAKNVKSQRNMAMDAVGCMSQLFPVMDFLNNPNYEKSLENGVGMTTEGIAPTAIVPFIEWWLNNDWKGAPIRRTGDKTELNPAWQNAYNNVPARLVDLNKWVNAKTNNIAPGNPEMKGNEVLDWATDPSMLNHFFGSWSGGMGTFVQRTAGLGAKATTGKADEIEVGDVPFLRSLFYTPREQSSMARTKAKWYNYKEEMEQTIANNDKLKSKNVPTMKRIENAAALEKFEGSPEQRKVNIIKNAEKRMRHWNTMRKKWADDKKQVDFANKNIEMIMQEAVEDLDRIE